MHRAGKEDGGRNRPAGESSADEGHVVTETERLLAGRKRDVKLTGHMLDRYRLQSWHQRSAVTRSWMVWVAGVSGAMTLINGLLIPHVFWTGALICCVLIPTLNAVIYCVWLKPRSAAVEGLSIVIWMGALILAFSAVGFMAGGFNMERYVTGSLFVVSIGILVLGIEIFWATFAVIVIVLLITALHLANPNLPPAQGEALSLFYAVGIFSTLVARKTLTIVSQHSFLMSLRDGHRREELARANVRLGELATTDALTGISNRRSAGDRIQGLWDDPSVDRTTIAFLMIDIDHFKRLNDSRGHAAGDDCIRAVAATIAGSVRSQSDIVSRYGGEEFLVVLARATPKLASDLAERIRVAVARLEIANPMSETAAIVTVSIGVALPAGDSPPETVAQWADEALYTAKRQGRNRVCVFAGGPPTEAAPPALAPVFDTSTGALALALAL